MREIPICEESAHSNSAIPEPLGREKAKPPMDRRSQTDATENPTCAQKPTLLALSNVIATAVVSGMTLAGCDGGGEDQGANVYPANEDQDGGKADGLPAQPQFVWHDFYDGGRDVLNRPWKTPGTWIPGTDEVLNLEFDDFSDPRRETFGTISVEAPCKPFEGAPGRSYAGGLGLLLAALSWLNALDCLSNDGFRSPDNSIRVFPYSARPRVIDDYEYLKKACSFPGDTGVEVQFFEWIYRRTAANALAYGYAMGCFRVDTSLGEPQLWIRVQKPEDRYSEPRHWGVLVSPDASCTSCISAGGGARCAPQCQGEVCVDCLENSGGSGCLPACISDACKTCLEYGGNVGCMDRCDNDYLPDECATCVEKSGGLGCAERCSL